MQRIRQLLERDSAERGFTLIEMLVCALLLSVVLGIVGGMMLSAITTQKSITKATDASSAAQLAADSIQVGIRNATDFELVAVGSDQLLMARTAGAGEPLTWRCKAWYFTAADGGSIRSAQWPVSAGAIVQPTSEPTDWTLLADGVTAPDNGPVLAVDGSILDITFNVTVDGHPPVEIATAASSRLQETSGSPCFG